MKALEQMLPLSDNSFFVSAILGDPGPSLPQWSRRRRSRRPQMYTVRNEQTHLSSTAQSSWWDPLYIPHLRSRCQGVAAPHRGRRDQGEDADGGSERRVRRTGGGVGRWGGRKRVSPVGRFLRVHHSHPRATGSRGERGLQPGRQPRDCRDLLMWRAGRRRKWQRGEKWECKVRQQRRKGEWKSRHCGLVQVWDRCYITCLSFSAAPPHLRRNPSIQSWALPAVVSGSGEAGVQTSPEWQATGKTGGFLQADEHRLHLHR